MTRTLALAVGVTVGIVVVFVVVFVVALLTATQQAPVGPTVNAACVQAAVDQAAVDSDRISDLVKQNTDERAKEEAFKATHGYIADVSRWNQLIHEQLDLDEELSAVRSQALTSAALCSFTGSTP